MGFTDNAINFNRVQYDAVKSDVKINFFITTPAFRQQKIPSCANMRGLEINIGVTYNTPKTR